MEWPGSPADLRPRRAPIKTPRPHQAAAVRDVVACLDTSPRARLVMACGTGKTLAALFAAEQMASRRTLVLVPSLSLLAQTLGEWLANACEPMEFKAVCSDATVADRDAPVVTTSDLGVPVTTDPDDIAAFLRGDGGQVHRVVFATYQSSQRIAEAMALEGVPAFDLAIADEAHRCTGPVSGDFATILDADAIRAHRRVFMTATPRYFTGRIIREAREADFEVASMDDEATFGPLAHKLSFGQAIRDGLLTDYQVAIIGVDDTMYRDWVERGQLVSPDGSKVTDARTLAGHIGLAKAMRDFDLRRSITFHSRVKRASDFALMLPAVIEWMPTDQRPEGSLDARHVSGNMSAGQRRTLLHRLREPQADRTLLANARCLTEGIDVPSLDGVAFIDPRRSEIDVVQAVGRAIRSAPDKKVGTIILPVFISDTDDPDTALNDSAFKTVWEVLNALRAHDEELAEWLDSMRRQLGRDPGNLVNLPGKVILDLPARVTPEFAHAIQVRLVEQTTASWQYWFALLEVYVAREGNARVPTMYREGDAQLGQWVANQRRQHERLPEDRRERLETLPGWTWDVLEAMWEAGFAALRDFFAREGHLRVPRKHREGDVGIGQWVSAQRSGREQLSAERRERLEAVPGWTWDSLDAKWEAGFTALTDFAAREGHARAPISHREGSIPLGSWVSAQRSGREQLSAERRERLEAVPGWTWGPVAEQWEAGFTALTELAAREGHARVPRECREGDFPLGQWVGRQRNRREQLSAERRERLEAVAGWTWAAFDAKWEAGFTALTGFVTREGHARVPSEHREAGVRLGQWVSAQRSGREQLSAERRERLEAVPGWTWDSLDAKSEAGFTALTDFAAREGHARVPNSHREGDIPLGKWVSRQRNRREQLSAERRERLEAVPGWTWDSLDAKWEAGFTALTDFAAREGHARVPNSHREGDIPLGKWVSRQRNRREQLSAERRERLEAVPGWAWDSLVEQWEAGFAALTAYVAREGHARVPNSHREGDVRLGQWVSTQRNQRKRMSAERRERLEAVPGWAWDSFDAQWEAGFTALTAYVAREGHARVPMTHREGDVLLGSWVSRQRTWGERLSVERRERLQAVPGWAWDSSAEQWEAGFTALTDYVAREGHARVPRKHQEGDVRLGEWVGHQRKGNEHLSVERRERLEAMPGWTWDSLAEQWEAGFTALTDYVAREGHARVPRNHREGDVLLGSWVSRQRTWGERLSVERRERLQAVPGWAWDSLAERWEAGFAALLNYVAREGQARVPDSHREGDVLLGRWVGRQRNRREQLSAERKERLEALPGWTWGPPWPSSGRQGSPP